MWSGSGCRRVEGLLRDSGALFGGTGNAALIRPGAENQPERPASIYLPCAWNKSVCVWVCVCVCVWPAHIQKLISRHLQRALYEPFRAHLFRFRVVLAQRLLKGNNLFPFSASVGPLLFGRFLIQIRITIKARIKLCTCVSFLLFLSSFLVVWSLLESWIFLCMSKTSPWGAFGCYNKSSPPPHTHTHCTPGRWA